jgi:hypothetical protein
MTVAGDTRKAGRNPEKAMVAMTAAIWASSLLAGQIGTTAAVSLPGGFLNEHMKETLKFQRRFFYELDTEQYQKIRKQAASLERWGYTPKEQRNTHIVQDNIFNDDNVDEADHGYYDWDITGTIKEAERYGLADAIRRAATSPGARALALTVSLRRAGTEYTINRWRELVNAAVADLPSRTVEFVEEIGYGGIYRKTARMMLLRAVIRDGGERYHKRKDRLTRMRDKTLTREYRKRVLKGRRGGMPRRELAIHRILSVQFSPVPMKRPDNTPVNHEARALAHLKQRYRAETSYKRGRFPPPRIMRERIAAAAA